MEIDEITKLARVSSPAFLILFGFLMYEKNFYISVGLFCAGVYLIYNEFILKKEKHDYLDFVRLDLLLIIFFVLDKLTFKR